MRADKTGYYSVTTKVANGTANTTKKLIEGEEINGDIQFISEEIYNESIEFYKQQVFDLIDKRTQELIFKGFDFGSCHWSLSITAQINWSNIPNLPDAIFPIQMQDQNGVDYKLQLVDKMNFYLTAVNAKNIHLQSGNSLCSQVDALQTIEEIINFIDPR